MKNGLIAIVVVFSVVLTALLTGCEFIAGLTTTTTPDSEEPPKEYSNEVQVIILLGQSNAEGHSYSQYLSKTVGEEKAALYAEGFDQVLISYANTIAQNTSNGEFVPVKLGQGTGIDRFGPEIGIAERISELDPEKRVVIIKYAYGGTTLSNEWRSPSSGAAGRLYNGAVEYIVQQLQALEAMDLYPIVKAICWMQGESDASGLSFNNYELLEENFVKDIREDLAYYKPVEGEIGFIDAGISDYIAWTQYEVINQAKKNLAAKDEYHDYIDTIEAGLKYNAEPVGAPDPYHYDSKYMVQLGHLFADVLIGRYIEY